MKSSKPVASQAMCEELLDKIVGNARLSEIRDLLLTFKAKGVRAPQIAHFLMSVLGQHQAGRADLALPDEVTAGNALHLTERGFGAAELGAPMLGDNAARASADDIHRHGWGTYIVGAETPVY